MMTLMRFNSQLLPKVNLTPFFFFLPLCVQKKGGIKVYPGSYCSFVRRVKVNCFLFCYCFVFATNTHNWARAFLNQIQYISSLNLWVVHKWRRNFRHSISPSSRFLVMCMDTLKCYRHRILGPFVPNLFISVQLKQRYLRMLKASKKASNI